MQYETAPPPPPKKIIIIWFPYSCSTIYIIMDLTWRSSADFVVNRSRSNTSLNFIRFPYLLSFNNNLPMMLEPLLILGSKGNGQGQTWRVCICSWHMSSCPFKTTLVEHSRTQSNIVTIFSVGRRIL